MGDIGETYSGLTGKSAPDFGHGDARFVTYMNVYKNTIADPDLVESVEIDNRQRVVEFGDVLFTTSSETPEEVAMSSVWLENKPNMYLNSFCFGFRPGIRIDPYYLAFLLRAPVFRKQAIVLAQGISRYNISKGKVMDITIPLPNNTEQTRIGHFFKTLDESIALHQ